MTPVPPLPILSAVTPKEAPTTLKIKQFLFLILPQVLSTWLHNLWQLLTVDVLDVLFGPAGGRMGEELDYYELSPRPQLCRFLVPDVVTLLVAFMLVSRSLLIGTHSFTTSRSTYHAIKCCFYSPHNVSS